MRFLHCAAIIDRLPCLVQRQVLVLWACRARHSCPELWQFLTPWLARTATPLSLSQCLWPCPYTWEWCLGLRLEPLQVELRLTLSQRLVGARPLRRAAPAQASLPQVGRGAAEAQQRAPRPLGQPQHAAAAALRLLQLLALVGCRPRHPQC